MKNQELQSEPLDHDLAQLAELFNQNNMSQCEAVARELTEKFPKHGFAWKVLGAVVQRLGRMDESLQIKRKAAELLPEDAEAHSNLANALLQKNLFAEAEKSCRKALAIDPMLLTIHKNLGSIFQKQGRFAEAEKSFHQVLALKPTDVDAHYNLGLILIKLDRLSEAENSFRNVLLFDQEHYNAHNELGAILQNQGRLSEAEAAYRRAAEIAPNKANIQANLGNVLLTQYRFPDAKEAYSRALALTPENSYIRGQRAYASRMLCEWSSTAEDNQQLLNELEQKHMSVLIPFSLLFTPIFNAEHQKFVGQSHADLVHKARLSVEPYVKKVRVSHKKRLRIGYLSADIYTHATVHLLAGVLENRNTEMFTTYLYSYGKNIKDPGRLRMEAACDHFREMSALSEEVIAKQILADKIDILVDLKGYTQDGRMGITALRPAPVIVSWLGYPGTLGHPRLADYIIGDPVVTPLAHANDFSETLALMPYCYQPNDCERVLGDAPSREEAGLPATGFVFCTFNQGYKITPEMFTLWCRLLNAVPHSVLWLLAPFPMLRENLQREAQQRGIDATRLIFAAMVPQAQHLARLQLADLAVDTFPYTSHTTASDALWAGVPLVTKMGETFASRVAASILQTMDLAELVTTNDEDYFNVVLSLAQSPEQLAKIKQKITENKLTSPLFDTLLFARDLERLYQAIWAQEVTGKRKAIVIDAEKSFVTSPEKIKDLKPAESVVQTTKSAVNLIPASLSEILRPNRLTEVVDIGANPIDGEPPYKPMLSAGLCRVTGFEPQQSALAELLAKKSENERYLPYAVGDGETHTLNICRASGMTSLFEPDATTLELFAVLKPLGEVIQRIEMTTRKLDDVTEIEGLDFLKIDIQGAELSVFKSGVQKLAQTVAIQVEVSFVTLYENQPAMGEVDVELRRQGFIPHCFAAVKKWPIAPCVMNNNPRQALNQLLEADIVYVRDFSKPDLMTDEQLKQLAMIVHHCYGSSDLALRCIMLLEERKALAVGSQKIYLDLLSRKL